VRTSLSGGRPVGGAAGAAVGLGLGLLALGPGLRRGFLLSYDMVFVPREPFSAALPGLAPPRAVPSDLVIAVLSRAVPADIAQKAVLLSIFVLACSGAAALLNREPLAARLAAGVFYAWNPYVGERLIIGQWALLLGYAGLPWVLRAVLADDLSSRRGAARLGLALLPAVVGGFAAMAITALVAVPAAAERASGRRGGDRAAGALVTLAALAAGSLPWLIPSLLHPVQVDPASVAAFASRADTPFGTIGSLLMLGGAWNAQTVPKAYGGAWSALWLAVVLAALAGYLLLARRRHRWPGMGLAAGAGLVIACLGVSAAGRDLLRSMIVAWPGFAVLRDAQQFVAPLALAEAAGFGLAVAAAMNPRSFGAGRSNRAYAARTRSGGMDAAGTRSGRMDAAGTRSGAVHAAGTRSGAVDAAGTIYGVVAILAPLLLLPGLAWGAAGRLRPVWYPAGWLTATRVVDADAARGSVLLLPWQTYRTPSWNHGETVLDPWTRLLSRPLIWNDGTRVGDVELAPDDPRARELDGAIRGSGPLTGVLRAAGVRFVLDDGPGAGDRGFGARLPGAVVILKQPGLTVYELPGLQDVGLARGDPGDLAAPRALHQALVLLIGHRDGLAGQHQRDAVLDPVQTAQPRVVQHRVVGEIEQAALVDGAHEDVEQCVLQGHYRLLAPAR
jgi:hypothetical protein